MHPRRSHGPRSGLGGIALALITAGVGACGGGGPPPHPGPPALGLDPAGLFAHWRAQRLDQLKMRHQVETRFLGRSEVVNGTVLLARPDRFWVRAQSPFGATLFDVKVDPPAPMQVDVRIDEIRDRRAPQFMARDIRRIYLATCPASAAVEAAPGGGAVVRCDLPQTEAPIQTDRGPDGPDQRLEMQISADGLLRHERFERDGQTTVLLDYSDYRPVDGHWLAHRIELKHQQIDYAISVQLLEADVHFDAASRFAPRPAAAAAKDTTTDAASSRVDDEGDAPSANDDAPTPPNTDPPPSP